MLDPTQFKSKQMWPAPTDEHRGASAFGVRMKKLTRNAAILSAMVIYTAGIQQAFADVYLGHLRCDIGGGFGVVIAASRNVSCAFERSDGASEQYAGYTGFVEVGLGREPPRNVSYEVFSTWEQNSGGLQGDYNTSLSLRSSERAVEVLAGPAGLYLRPLGAQLMAVSSILNKLSSLGTLHLIYAGVTHPRRGTRHRN